MNIWSTFCSRLQFVFKLSILYIASAYFLDLNWNQTALGKLKTPRITHMCGTLTKGYESYLVVVGGVTQNEITSDCEYVHYPDREWKSCANLPQPLSYGQMVNDPETGDLLLLGGQDNWGHFQDTIYRLSDIDQDWVLEDQTLKVGRCAFSAIFLPDGILDCDNNAQHDEL